MKYFSVIVPVYLGFNDVVCTCIHLCVLRYMDNSCESLIIFTVCTYAVCMHNAVLWPIVCCPAICLTLVKCSIRMAGHVIMQLVLRGTLDTLVF